MAITYRLQKNKYNNTVLSGEGAKLVGGRWNAVGTPLIYTSETSSLAVLESVVHAQKDTQHHRSQLNFVVIDVPDECIRHFKFADLPVGWNTVPSGTCAQCFLAPFLEKGEQLAYSVPSVANPEERNILIDPNHVDISKVVLLGYIPYSFDRRLVTQPVDSLVEPESLAV